jgi:hypothetical protein
MIMRLPEEAEGEGFEPPRDQTAPCDFRDLKHLAQPCALRRGARHNARQFARRTCLAAVLILLLAARLRMTIRPGPSCGRKSRERRSRAGNSPSRHALSSRREATASRMTPSRTFAFR